MIQFLLHWDTQKKSVSIKWNGFFALVWNKGKLLMKIIGVSIPYLPRQRKLHRYKIRWVYIKELLYFLTKWKIKKVNGTFSFSDPMINGCLFGWVSTIQTMKLYPRINLTINFLGENQFSGEAILPLKAFLNHLKRGLFILLKEKSRRGLQKGGV